jgi:CRP-like cAMP-binding protein
VEFVRKFSNRLSLTPDELPLLEVIFSAAKPLRRRYDLVTEGQRNRAIFVVVDGLLMRYRITRDGQRQVINLMVPGDLVGAPSCFFDAALYSVRTLTNSVVAALPLDVLAGLLDTQPRFAGKLFWLFSCDAAILVEHLVVVGRRSARERIAHFFLELLIRLQAVGLADDKSYCMPFSQDIICDALGLSLAYVNRELRSLASDGLVSFGDHKIVINDVDALRDIADFEHRYLRPSPASEFFATPTALPAPATTPALYFH